MLDRTAHWGTRAYPDKEYVGSNEISTARSIWEKPFHARTSGEIGLAEAVIHQAIVDMQYGAAKIRYSTATAVLYGGLDYWLELIDVWEGHLLRDSLYGLAEAIQRNPTK